MRSFSTLRVLVIGDLMLDHWVWGSVSRISPEAPVPVVDVERYSYTPGGAANVVSNLCALGSRVSLLGVVGLDDSARKLRGLLNRQGVDVSGLIPDRTRPTSLKTRIIAHSQQVVRADFEQRAPLRDPPLKKMRRWLAGAGCFDAVMLSDYDKGLFRTPGIEELLSELRDRPRIAGPKPENLDRFAGMDLITLNAREAAAASGLDTAREEGVLEAGRALRQRLGGRGAVLITRGEHGMSLFEEGEPRTVPALATQVFDVSGAGDTVLTVAGLCLAAGASLDDAIVLASHAAAVVVRKIGTAVATPAEVVRSLGKRS
ncbi:MAG: D-glycero-beta-D-manno-heptose-7-phosphate kinase [Armatimonadetes bacterium]|nr:D-glycero-beta-D-manno-heptose-7-phosphate kinase [Armatimonadota bacterium]